MFGKELEYADYGYGSMIKMCKDLENIFHTIRPDKGDFKLYDANKPIPSDAYKHFKPSEYIKLGNLHTSDHSTESALGDVTVCITLITMQYMQT